MTRLPTGREILGLKIAAIAALAWMVAACSLGGVPDSKVYTLYRSGVLDTKMRLHVATFDADDGNTTEEYNHDNCEQAAALFQSQPRVITKFWCEKGRFRI